MSTPDCPTQVATEATTNPAGPEPRQNGDGAAEMYAAGTKRQRSEDAPGPQPKRPQLQGDTVLRLLVPGSKAAAIIGRQGLNLQSIRESTGAQVKVLEGLPGTDDRVVIISSHDTEEEFNAAQRALFEAYRCAYSGSDPSSASSAEGAGTLAVRMLVQYSQAGTIIGKAGATIKATKEASGAVVKVLPQEELPLCALSNDRLVVFTGTFPTILKAAEIVSRQIREHPAKEHPGGPSSAFLLHFNPPPSHTPHPPGPHSYTPLPTLQQPHHVRQPPPLPEPYHVPAPAPLPVYQSASRNLPAASAPQYFGGPSFPPPQGPHAHHPAAPPAAIYGHHQPSVGPPVPPPRPPHPAPHQFYPPPPPMRPPPFMAPPTR